MKFTLSWLNDHLATKATLDDILALMLQAGLEVEEVVDPRREAGGVYGLQGQGG